MLSCWYISFLILFCMLTCLPVTSTPTSLVQWNNKTAIILRIKATYRFTSMDFPFLRLTWLLAMPCTSLQQPPSKVSMWCGAHLGVSANRPVARWLHSMLVEAEFYVQWNRTTDFVMIPPLLPSFHGSISLWIHALVTITHQCFWSRYSTYRQKV